MQAELQKRSLYLFENENRITVHRDGPSVLITKKGKAPTRIPVKLVDKVIVIGNIRIDSYSLLLFSENQIPVLFLDNKNREQALLLPYNHKLPAFYKAQKILLNSEQSVKRFRKWIKTRRMFEQVRVLRTLFKNFTIPDEIGEGNYQFILSKIKTHNEKWNIVKEVVQNFIKAVVAGRLLRAQIDLHLGVIHKRVNFGLLLDLLMIFEPEADLETVEFFLTTGVSSDNNLTEPEIKSIIERFESRRHLIANVVETVIDEFIEILRDIRK